MKKKTKAMILVGACTAATIVAGYFTFSLAGAFIVLVVSLAVFLLILACLEIFEF